jgi:hypothetical protein
MEHQEYVAFLDNIRSNLHILLQEASLPAVERLLQDADIQFHTALWLLEEVRGLTPEGEVHSASETVYAQFPLINLKSPAEV